MDNINIKVWWVQCKPFKPEERDSDESRLFQKKCLEDRFFGMGWGKEEYKKYVGREFDGEIAKEFKEKETEQRRAFTVAQNKYGDMKQGDVVLSRLDDIYYLGIIKFKPRVSDNEKLTWYSEVDEWRKLGSSKELPHHIRGKLSSRNYHGTVAEIDGLSAWTLIDFAGIKCPKKKINADDFFTSIGDEDLEDLMAHYMSNVKKGYVFLPSSCKKNTPGVEYIMYDPHTNKMIACQTKVNRPIDVGEYIENQHIYGKYEVIYLFSGDGYYENYKEEDLKNICIVKNEELYETLKGNKYFESIVSQYFDFE